MGAFTNASIYVYAAGNMSAILAMGLSSPLLQDTANPWLYQPVGLNVIGICEDRTQSDPECALANIFILGLDTSAELDSDPISMQLVTSAFVSGLSDIRLKNGK